MTDTVGKMTRKALEQSTLALLLIGALTADARAQEGDSELDSVDLLELLNVEVSTASKTAESATDAAAIITVIGAEEIARWGYQSVGEALQHVVGFYLIDDHVLPNAGVRGIAGGLAAESGSVKVMIDGASVAFRSTSGNWLGVELIPLGSIAQIEVIRGPASALYGADAFLGVVNIITLPPDDIPLVRGAIHAGSAGGNFGGQFDVVGGKRIGSFDFLLGAAGEAQDRSGLALPSESPAPIVPSYADIGAATRNLKRRSLVFEGRAGYRRPDGQITLHAFASGIERGGDLAYWAQLTNGLDAQGRPVGTVINLGQARVTANGEWAIAPELRLSAQSTYFQGGLLPNDRIEVASDLFWVKRRLGYRGVDATIEGYWAPRADFNLIIGAEAVVDRELLPTPERVSKETGEVLGGEVPKRSVTLSNLGAFLSSNWKLWEPLLKLTYGVRFDQHSTYGSQLTGRLGATSEWSPWLVTKVLYGSAFKAPSPYLLYAEPLRAGDLIGVRNLKPQHVDTLEFQGILNLGPAFSASSGLAYNLIREKAEFVPQGLNQIAQNIAKQQTYSWETRLDANYRQRLAGYAAFEWIHSHRDLGQGGYAAQVLGTENVAYPNWIARAGATLRARFHPDIPLELSTQAILVGPTPAADASIVERGERFELPSYLWLNASLAAPNLFLIAGHETTLAVRAKNLLGERGPVPGFSGFEYPLAPREVFLELQHSY
jgi:iron complex outermembrane receptor protein